MAVTINRYSIVFDMGTPTEDSLVDIFENAVRKQLPEEKADTVMGLLATCDFYNGGMYGSARFGELTNATLTYWTRTEKVHIGLEYGDFRDGEMLALGYIRKGLLNSLTLGCVKEDITYLGNMITDSNKVNTLKGYDIEFTLQIANK